MTKPTQATLFRKRQILPASGLNKALQTYGSVDGVVPYKADGTQDTSMSAPLGTKAAPFGNAHFKGFNMYTQLEVQQMVESGMLGADDRFVFWNLDTNNLSAWNGTEIIHLSGNGGGNMDYLFGDGNDGDVTMVSNGVYDTVKNFTNFTLNSGVTLSVTSPLTPLIIRCTGVCTINGIIDVTGKGFPASRGHGISSSPFTKNTVGEHANPSQLYAKFMGLDFSPVFGSGGAPGLSSGGGIGFNGGGAGGASGSEGGTIGGGGNGGGAVIIVAKKIVLNGTVSANGANGIGGNGSFVVGTPSYFRCGGGGGGGSVLFMGNEVSIVGAINVNGGAGGTGTKYASNGSAGGNGASATIKI